MQWNVQKIKPGINLNALTCYGYPQFLKKVFALNVLIKLEQKYKTTSKRSTFGNFYCMRI